MITSKYSEKYIREEKVKKLKEKILREIEHHFNQGKENLSFMLNDEDDEDRQWFEQEILEMSCLIQLKQYIERYEKAFLMCESYSEQHDYINYVIDDDYIDFYLQDDFDFTCRFLSEAEDKGYNAMDILERADYSFMTGFLTIIEFCAYQDKKKQKEVKKDE